MAQLGTFTMTLYPNLIPKQEDLLRKKEVKNEKKFKRARKND